MKFSTSSSQWIAGTLLYLGLVNAHTVIVYPGYRGNNLHTTGTVEGVDGLGVAYDSDNDTLVYPYGMQWAYPCMSLETSGLESRVSLSMLMLFSRRRHAHHHEPDDMACPWRRVFISTRLVSGPLSSNDISEPGSRNRTSEHEPSHDHAFRNRRSG
ncbi:uncharacterized protein BJX67DRAFT_42775 [Aspergillus lucknowensis]|uniref:Uncharacterized protein n=1 Tax=Aspergillus lucknowensis TaxID=176173 RepID=A0ABR4LVD3_9EURO